MTIAELADWVDSVRYLVLDKDAATEAEAIFRALADLQPQAREAEKELGDSIDHWTPYNIADDDMMKRHRSLLERVAALGESDE